MAIYHDTDFDGLKVGTELLELGECQRYIDNNYMAIRKRLEKAMGYLPQWKKDMRDRGIEIVEPQINENWRPLPYKVARIVTVPTGYQQFDLVRQKDEHSAVQRLHLTVSDLTNAFTMKSFDDFLNEKLQGTVDDIKQSIANQAKLELQERELKDAEELKQARAVLEDHKSLSKYVREAVEMDTYQMAPVSNAIKVIKNAEKLQRKGCDFDLADVVDKYASNHPASVILNAQ